MPSRASGLRGRDPTLSLPGAAAVAAAATAGQHLSRGLALTIAFLLCYTLLEASLGVWWFVQLRSVGPCQPDNEVGACRRLGTLQHRATPAW
jgi:hypothetical protein